MRGKWTFRLVLVLLIGCVVAGGIWYRGRSLRGAREAFEEKSWYKAIALAQAHLARQPEDDEARRILARSLSRLGQWQDAEAAYAAIRSPIKDDFKERSNALVRQSQWFEAAYVLEQLLAKEPEEPYALQQLAVLRSKQGRDLEAIALAQRLAKLPGREAVAQAMLATLHQSRDNLVGAVDCWKRVIELDPEGKSLAGTIAPEKVRLDLADCLLKLGRWEESLPYLDFVEQRQPEESQVQFLRGWAWLHQGETDKAREFWTRVLKMAPDAPDVLTKLGELELQTGRNAEALEYLKKSIELRPDAADVHAALARVYQSMGETELSREHRILGEQLVQKRENQGKARRFMQLDPSSPEGKLAMGVQLAHDGKWQDAEVWVREVLRSNPKDELAQRVLQDILARRPPPELIFQ